MNELAIKLSGNLFFSDEYLKKCKKIYKDTTRYYAANSKLCQESCCVYLDNNQFIACFNFSDCGIRDIHALGAYLIIEIDHNEYQLEEIEAYVKYTVDNKLSLCFVGSKPLLVERCKVKIGWIQYMGTSSADAVKFNEDFVVPSKSELSSILKINRIRKGSQEKRINKKDAIPTEKVSIAWKAYSELSDSMTALRSLNSKAKRYKMIIRSTKHSDYGELIFVPINCYFDKGFYATVYYIRDCPVVEKRLSGGKSAIQCVVGIDKNDLDLLMYLYYCTISDRDYYQYLDDNQIRLKTHLENEHPIMKLERKLSDMRENFGYMEVIEKSDVVQETIEILSDCRRKLKEFKEQAYKNLSSHHQLQGKWVNEIKLYALIKVLFPDAQYQYMAEWLGSQSLDIYIPAINCGVEYQGQQHYEPVEFFGGTSQLQEQYKLDACKREKCREQGISLLEWPYLRKVTMENVCDFFKNSGKIGYLDEKSIERQVSTYPITYMGDFLIPTYDK